VVLIFFPYLQHLGPKFFASDSHEVLNLFDPH
jgi:hypothetical protein